MRAARIRRPTIASSPGCNIQTPTTSVFASAGMPWLGFCPVFGFSSIDGVGGWPTLSQRALPQLRLPQPLRFSKAGDFYCRHRKCLPCTTLHLSTSLFVHQHQPAFAISIRPEAAPSSDFVNCGSYGQAEDRERRKTTADSAHISRTIPRQSRATVAFRPVLAKDCYFYQFLKSEKMRDGGVPQIRRKGLSEPRLGVLVLTLTGVLACPITRLT